MDGNLDWLSVIVAGNKFSLKDLKYVIEVRTTKLETLGINSLKVLVDPRTDVVPVRAVVRHASIALPPFFSASVPACTASELLVPATMPLPSLNASGLGRRRALWRESASNLWRSRGNQALGENETASGWKKANAPHPNDKKTKATNISRFMALR